MSLVYWGIVAGIVSMVATLFVSLALLGSKTGSSDAATRLDEPQETIPQASSGRRAA